MKMSARTIITGLTVSFSALSGPLMADTHYVVINNSTIRRSIGKTTGRTNGLFFLTPADQTFSYGESNVWLKTADIPVKGDSPKSRDYPLVVLRDDKETPATADNGVATTPVQTIDSDTSVFGDFTGNKILDWMPRPESANKGKKAKGDVQKIVFKSEGRLHGNIKIPGYEDLILPQPAWYEWFSPRLFLTKWADYWFNGCDATPVVFVSFTF